MPPIDNSGEENLSDLKHRIAVLEHALRQELDEKSALERELLEIKNSFAWVSILKYRVVRDRLFPIRDETPWRLRSCKKHI